MSSDDPREDGYHGLPAGHLDNGELRLEYLTESGPRIVRLLLHGSADNLLAEVPHLSWSTPHGLYFPRGGHRLWVAPEMVGRTAIPDDDGLQVEPLPDGVRLLQPTERPTGIRKSLEIHLPPGEPRAVLHHELANDGPASVEVAPWAITMLRPGGVAVLPQPTEPADPDGLLPNRSLVLWPYTHWRDPRIHPTDPFLFIDSRPLGSPCKVGTLNRSGWSGYLSGDVLFVKRYAAQPDQPHTDMGCNTEVYVCHAYLELESLAPLCRLNPGDSVMHTETWEVLRNPESPDTPEPYRRALEELRQVRRASSR
jgi:hypothetical protein